MEPNFPELKWLNEWIQQQDKLPESAKEREWLQEGWVWTREERIEAIEDTDPMCGTAYCAAGKTVVRAGHTLDMRPQDGDMWMFLDGRIASAKEVSGHARLILGLSNIEADTLFAAINTAERIDKLIRSIFLGFGVDYDTTEAAK